MNNKISMHESKTKIKTEAVNLFYGDFQALGNVTMDIVECAITALIG